ncbi:DNA adenine methylase [Rhodanobacter lindaniclasticus]
MGNKQRFAKELISHFPAEFNAYFEPFVGSGAVLATLAPREGYAGDVFAPLVEIWSTLKRDPGQVIAWYAERRTLMDQLGKVEAYERVRDSYNRAANGADLLFLRGPVLAVWCVSASRMAICPHRAAPTCPYRWRGFGSARWNGVPASRVPSSSTATTASSWGAPVGRRRLLRSTVCRFASHPLWRPGFPVARVVRRHRRMQATRCVRGIEHRRCQKSGRNVVDIAPPEGLFAKELQVHCGRSMLRRFQMDGRTLETEHVSDRLLLTH